MDGPESILGLFALGALGLIVWMVLASFTTAWNDCGHFPVWHGRVPGVGHYTVGMGCGYGDKVTYFFGGE
jgi:hypothetical protein